MTDYGPMDILWLDGGQVRPPAQDIEMAGLADDGPEAPAGSDRRRPHGGRPLRELPHARAGGPREGAAHVWETCMTMGTSGRTSRTTNTNPRASSSTCWSTSWPRAAISCSTSARPGGRPARDRVERMKEIGDWMEVNGEAIYGTRAIAPYKDGQVVFTRKGEKRLRNLPRRRGTNSDRPERIQIPAGPQREIRPAARLRRPAGYGRSADGRPVHHGPAGHPPIAPLRPRLGLRDFRRKHNGQLAVAIDPWRANPGS